MSSPLLERYRRDRSNDAMEQLVAQYWPLVLSVARRYCARPDDAEDVAQETFMKLLRHVDQITGNLGAWLSTAARTTSIDLLRKRRRMPQDGTGEWIESQPDPAITSATVGRSMLISRLTESMTYIDPWARRLLVERFFRRTPLRTLAAGAKVSIATMSRRCAAAVSQLSEIFKDMGLDLSDEQSLRTWLDQIDPPSRSGCGDLHDLAAGPWSGDATMSRFRPGADVPMPPGWTRPIRVGVIVSWFDWSQPIPILGYYNVPDTSLSATGKISHPGYRLFAIIDPGTSHLGIVESSIREWEINDGLMYWNDEDALSSLDVIVLGHSFFVADEALANLHAAVRRGVGLFNESYCGFSPIDADPRVLDLSLAKPPMFKYCTPYRHALPRPARVVATHPIIDGLAVGQEFTVPGCGMIFKPAENTRVLIMRTDPVRPTFVNPPGHVPIPMPAMITGQLGRGRVIKLNTNQGMPFHQLESINGCFTTNCINWLAEPRRGCDES